MKFAVQLYNFREALSKDFQGTLRAIATLGFDGVEFAGYYGEMSPEALADFMKSLKLKCAGTMFTPAMLSDVNSIAYAYAEKLNSPAVTVSYMCDFTATYQSVIDSCNIFGTNAKSHNLVFSYHNHWGEFARIGEDTFMDRLLAETPPDAVYVEPDVCWITRAGYSPAEFIARYAKRIRQIHLKDIKVPADPATTTALGSGVVDLSSAFAAAQSSDCRWVIYEQDYSCDPFADARKSLAFLRTLQKS